MARTTPITGLAKWVEREQWQEPFGEVLQDHLETALDDDGMDVEELIEALGAEDFAAVWTAAFEDFVSRDHDDGDNVLDDYLRRRGWKESPGTRDYLKALRQSVMSLYDVVEVAPGQSLTLRDRLRGGDPLVVSEPATSRALAAGEVIATRVLPVRRTLRLSATVLDLRELAVAAAETRLRLLQEAVSETAPELLDEIGEGPDPALAEALTGLETVLGAAAPVFSEVWLQQQLDEIWDAPGPRLIDADGEPYAVTTASHKLAEGADPKALAAALDGIPELRRQSEGETAWQWHESEASDEDPEQREADAAAGLVRIAERDEEGHLLLGSVELEDDTLSLFTSSASRAERGAAMLAAVLGPLIGEPHVEVASPEETAQTLLAMLDGAGDEDGDETRH